MAATTYTQASQCRYQTETSVDTTKKKRTVPKERTNPTKKPKNALVFLTPDCSPETQSREGGVVKYPAVGTIDCTVGCGGGGGKYLSGVVPEKVGAGASTGVMKAIKKKVTKKGGGIPTSTKGPND